MISSNWLQSRAVIRLLPVTILVILGMLWGGVPSLSKYVGQQGVSPLSYAFWILTIAASVLIIINFVRGAGLPPARHLVFYVICGVSGSAIPTTCMYYSVAHIPAGLMILLIGIAPILTYQFAVIFSVEKYHPLKTLGLLFTFIGLVLILLPDSVTELNAPVPWILFALLTPTFYAVNIVYTSIYRPENIHIFDLSSGMLIAAAAFMFAVTILFEPLYPLWNAEPIIALLMFYHGTLTATAFCLFYSLLKISGPLFSSQVTYSVTLFGIAIAAYVHDEVLPLLVWVAAGLMFAGIGFIQKGRSLTDENQSANPSET